MIKFKAILEVLYLAIYLIVTGLYEVIFNDKRFDFDIKLKPLYKKKKVINPTDKELFLDFMARNT